MTARYPGLTPTEATLVDRVHHLEASLADAEAACTDARLRAREARFDQDTDAAYAAEEDVVYWGRQAEDRAGELEQATSDMHAAGIAQPVEPDTGPDLPIGGTR